MNAVNDPTPGSSQAPDAEDLADALFAQHQERAAFRPLSTLSGIAQAYAVQDHLVRRLTGRFGDPVGYKIGLTSERMQRMCGIDQPVAGVVLRDRVLSSGATLHLSRHGRAGLEFEICIRMGRALPPRAKPYSVDEVAAAAEAVCAAIEVIDDRNADYKTLEALSLVADNSWNAGVVLGPFTDRCSDLEGIHGTVQFNGAEVDGGYGRDVLGSPFVPLAWLANRLAASGRGLEAGEIVMTGNLVTTHFPKPGDAYEFRLGNVSAVALRIED